MSKEAQIRAAINHKLIEMGERERCVPFPGRARENTGRVNLFLLSAG